jgi:S1-C subfamily serine protease
VNLFDVLVLAVLVSAGLAGWRLGFLTRVSSWLGAGLGLVLALRTLPWIVDRLEDTDSLRLALTGGGVLVAGVSVGSLIGLFVGSRVRGVVGGSSMSTVDRVAGAITGCVGVVLAVWLIVPLMADFSEWPAEQARHSQVARVIDDVLPPPPDGVQALRRVIGVDEFPRVWNALHPTPDLAEPPTSTGISDEVTAAVARSIVRIEGSACRRIQLGTGVVLDEGIVVTNAHVVAGEDSTSVIRDDGQSFEGQVVLYDPATDIAVLRVPGIDRRALPLGDAGVGSQGGVFGHPNGGDLRIAPYQVARRVTATGTDIYDENRVSREVYFIASDLRPGDSGAPLVDATGAVVGLAFAIAPDRPGVAYALTVPEIRAALNSTIGVPTGTGECLF